MKLNARDWTTITNGLRTAADYYEALSSAQRQGLITSGPGNGNSIRLAEQFARQAGEARELAERIEDEEGV